MQARAFHPEVLVLIAALGCMPNRASAESNRGRAKFDVKTLEIAAMAYKTNHHQWPATLKVLTERGENGKLPYLEPLAIIDPWNHPYHMDTEQLNPVNGVPLIWSDGH